MNMASSTVRPVENGTGSHGGSDQIVQFWSDTDVDRRVKSEELTQALVRWRKMVASKLPRLNEFLGPNPTPVLHNAMMMIPKSDDLFCVHHGPGAVKMFGANFIGTKHGERSHPSSAAIRKVYLHAATLGQPFYLHFVPPFSKEHFQVEQIVLPLAMDEQREISFLLTYTAPMDDQIEGLKAIFERSPIGMIAAVPHSDGSGKFKDGRVLMINARARQVLRIPPGSNNIVCLGDLGAWFKEGRLWTKTNMTMDSGQTHVHYRDVSSNKSYRLTIEPIDRFLLFSIIEIAALTG